MRTETQGNPSSRRQPANFSTFRADKNCYILRLTGGSWAVRKIFIIGCFGIWTSCFVPCADSQAPATSSMPASASSQAGFVGDQSCTTCHEDKTNSYLRTAHHLTSRLASKDSIMGPFAPGQNTMTTFNPQLSFLMEARDGHFYETALLRKANQPARHTEEIALVVGSATRGQTYLYWKENRLYELPVSYWTELRGWVNSPGYVDGSADFDRPVTPRCIECHATFFEMLGSSTSDNQYSKRNFILGISCERCHGPAQQHVAERAANSSTGNSAGPVPPIGLNRDREIDVCAQCHAGVGKTIAPPFSFQPGEVLSQYIALPQPGPMEPVDVHGNQVALLERSRCFQSSTTLSCSTCHDVHAREMPAPSYSAACLRCHKEKDCGESAKLGARISQNCIDCHMPVQASKTLALDVDDDNRLPAKVRNHWIRVYSKSN
jgi:Cytochrome c554 and c-prime